MKHQYFLLAVCSSLLVTLPCSLSYALPRVIQGGMGVRISSWKLAREVARKGEMGVISGTAMDAIMVRTLQNGDPGGLFRRAMASFPDQDMVNRAMEKYFVEGGKKDNKPFKSLPFWTFEPSQALLEVTVLGNYCEVWLAKHNDDGSPIEGPVGINRLTKVQLPTIPSLYGAMLADVDYVLMGAGIPMMIPAILDSLSEGKECKFPIEIYGLPNGDTNLNSEFSPSNFWINAGKPDLASATLKRPKFIPIVSSVVLAQSMIKRAGGKGPTKGIDGFVVELPTAGGHNAPPRGFRYDAETKTHATDLNEIGEPVYGPKDEVDLSKFLKATKGLPFWLAGSYARPEKFREIMELGGAGIQAGTLFALCNESGLDDKVRQDILSKLVRRDADVFTDPAASPTGFPFKVLQLDGSLSEETKYENRLRVCNLGYLRTPFVKPDGKIGYRCASEPVEEWVKKGGDPEATMGRKCLCNSLCANAGFPQVRNIKKNGKTEQYIEDILITIGDDVNSCKHFLKQDKNGKWGYSACDVVDYLLSEWDACSKDKPEVKRGEILGHSTH